MTPETSTREAECCIRQREAGEYDHWRHKGATHAEAAAKVQALYQPQPGAHTPAKEPMCRESA